MFSVRIEENISILRFIENAHMDMHSSAVMPIERFGHERGDQTLPGGKVLDDLLEGDSGICRGEGAAILEINLGAALL